MLLASQQHQASKTACTCTCLLCYKVEKLGQRHQNENEPPANSKFDSEVLSNYVAEPVGPSSMCRLLVPGAHFLYPKSKVPDGDSLDAYRGRGDDLVVGVG